MTSTRDKVVTVTHETAQGEEDVAPPVVRATMNVARVVFPAALAWEEDQSDDSGQHRAKGEEHTEQGEEVLLRMRKVFEEQRAVCRHRAAVPLA